MNIYECSLPWCFCWSCVRNILIWKMCSFTKLPGRIWKDWQNQLIWQYFETANFQNKPFFFFKWWKNWAVKKTAGIFAKNNWLTHNFINSTLIFARRKESKYNDSWGNLYFSNHISHFNAVVKNWCSCLKLDVTFTWHILLRGPIYSQCKKQHEKEYWLVTATYQLKVQKTRNFWQKQ